jgi:hypothetical protein
LGVTSMSKVGTGKREARESLLRAVNNRIRVEGGSLAIDAPAEFLCECGAADCVLTVELSPEEYDQVAAVPGRLLLATEHLGQLDGHRVVAERERYVVLAPSA